MTEDVKAAGVVGNDNEAGGQEDGRATADAAGREPEEKPQATVFDFSESVRAAGAELDTARAASFGKLLNELGVRDNAAANRLAAFGMEYLQEGLAGLPAVRERRYSEETYRHYGCTKEEPNERFKDDFAKVGQALEVIEAKVPGLREVFEENGLGSNLRIVQAFALIGDLLGEDKNFMSGAAGGSGAKTSIYKTDLTKI